MGQMSGGFSVPPTVLPVVTATPVVAAPLTGSGGARTTPPQPPRSMGTKAAVAPPPLGEDSLDVDDAALLEETHYENEGSDFAMAFVGAPLRDETESTAIGNMPLRDSFAGGETQLDADLDAGLDPLDSPGGKPPGKPGW